MSEIVCACCQAVGEMPLPLATTTCANCRRGGVIQPICAECAQDSVCCECREHGAILCHTCGAVVEDDALARQTMADGSLMWPRPFCAACLLAGLRRLDAELKRQPGKDGDA